MADGLWNCRGAPPKRTAPQPPKDSAPSSATTYKAKSPQDQVAPSFEEVRPVDDNTTDGSASVSEGLQRLKLGKWDTPIASGDSGNILFGAFNAGTEETPPNSKTPIGSANLWTTANSSPTPANTQPQQASPLVGAKKNSPVSLTLNTIPLWPLCKVIIVLLIPHTTISQLSSSLTRLSTRFSYYYSQRRLQAHFRASRRCPRVGSPRALVLRPM